MDIIETMQRGDYRINIVHDPFPCNPRECCDNLGHMVCWHPRHILGDERPKTDPQDWYAEHCEEYYIILPLYLLDHSGLALSTKPFNDPWDAAQVGWIYRLEAEYGLMRDIDLIDAILRDEVVTYSAYLNGNCYGFQIILDDNVPFRLFPFREQLWDGTDGELVDDCYGFYDIDQCISEANATVDEILK